MIPTDHPEQGTPPMPPEHLGSAARALFFDVLADFELPPNDVAVLAEACTSLDNVHRLQQQVKDDGLMIPSSQGMRLHPAIAEARQQRLVVARLLASLGVLNVVDEDLPASRGVRGTYNRKA